MQKSKGNIHKGEQITVRAESPFRQKMEARLQLAGQKLREGAVPKESPNDTDALAPWHSYVERAENLSRKGDHVGSARMYRIAAQQCTDNRQSAFLLLNGAIEQDRAADLAGPAQKKALTERAASDYATAARKLEEAGEIAVAFHAHAKAAIGHSQSNNPFHAPKAAAHAAHMERLLPHVEVALA